MTAAEQVALKKRTAVAAVPKQSRGALRHPVVEFTMAAAAASMACVLSNPVCCVHFVCYALLFGAPVDCAGSPAILSLP